MRIFVTGATGFIGSRVTRQLLEGGHEVAALLRPGSRSTRLVDISSRLDRITGDLSRLDGRVGAEIAAWRPDACIHLAWYAEPGKYLDATENLPALSGSLRLIEMLMECGCPHFVGAGTCAEYAECHKPVVEMDRTDPQTLYAACKLALCLTGQQLARLGKLRFAWGRVFHLYGPGEDARRAVPALIRALLRGEEFDATGGEQVRDYLHVDDVAAAFVTMAVRGVSGVYNIASGDPVTMRHLMQAVGSAMAREHLIRFGAVPYRKWEPMFIAGNADRLRSLGWKPARGLHEGLASAIGYWRAEMQKNDA